MTVFELLTDLQRQGFSLRPLPGDKLEVGPASKLTPKLREELRQRKAELLELLRPGIKAYDVVEVFPGAEILYTTPPASCRTCGGQTWWVNFYNWPLCGTCFPPSLPGMVKEWVTGRAAA